MQVGISVIERLINHFASGLSIASFLLGAMLVLLADMGLNWNHRRMRRQRIRRQYIIELENMGPALRELRAAVEEDGDPSDVTLYASRLEPDIFRGNVDDLKYLRPRELKVTYSFYAGLKELLNTVKTNDGTLPSARFSTSGSPIDTLEQLSRARRAALLELSRHPDTLYGQIPEDRGPL